MFEEEDNYIFNNNYYDECSFGSNNMLGQELSNFEFEVKNF